jgi:outer membrane protein assembly factor BamB
MKLLRFIGCLTGLFNLILLAGHAQPAITNLWTLTLARYDSESSPAIAPDGTIYVGTFEGRLLAITPAGHIKWAFDEGVEIKSSPAIADDGTIYFGARDRKFYALTPGGKLKWTFTTGAWVDSSPAIAADGTVYFGSWDKKFYALNPDGSLKWSFATSNIVVSSPAIGLDGTIYFGSHDGKFYALKPDGIVRWTFATGGPIVSSPAIAGDGTIYFTSTDGNVYALQRDGTERWHLHKGGFTESSPVLDAQGNLYLGVNETKACISPAGKTVWDFGAPILIDTTPTATANGLVYFTESWRDLGAHDPKGALIWSASTAGRVMSAAAIAPDGILYLTTGRLLYAITATNGAPLAASSWPMFRANLRHTGRVADRH